MGDRNGKTDELDTLFARARRDAPQLPAGLMQRILADAERVQAGFEPAGAGAAAGNRPGMWSQLLSALGGWPAMGGLVTAGAAGVWIGLAPPSFLPDVTRYVFEDNRDINLIDVDELVAALSEEG